METDPEPVSFDIQKREVVILGRKKLRTSGAGLHGGHEVQGHRRQVRRDAEHREILDGRIQKGRLTEGLMRSHKLGEPIFQLFGLAAKI